MELSQTRCCRVYQHFDPFATVTIYRYNYNNIMIMYNSSTVIYSIGNKTTYKLMLLIACTSFKNKTLHDDICRTFVYYEQLTPRRKSVKTYRFVDHDGMISDRICRAIVNCTHSERVVKRVNLESYFCEVIFDLQ